MFRNISATTKVDPGYIPTHQIIDNIFNYIAQSERKFGIVRMPCNQSDIRRETERTIEQYLKEDFPNIRFFHEVNLSLLSRINGANLQDIYKSSTYAYSCKDSLIDLGKTDVVMECVNRPNNISDIIREVQRNKALLRHTCVESGGRTSLGIVVFSYLVKFNADVPDADYVLDYLESFDNDIVRACPQARVEFDCLDSCIERNMCHIVGVIPNS